METITTRSRNLGYGWNNIPERYTLPDGSNGLRIRSVTHPDTEGGIRSVERERAHAARINSGGEYWNEALFVGGRKVARVDGVTRDLVSEALYWLREHGEVEVGLEDR